VNADVAAGLVLQRRHVVSDVTRHHEPRLRQAPALLPAHVRYARTIPTALAKITRAVKAGDSDTARAAMVDHIAQWARLNPDASDV
jgi:DNA-binding GntR family transcriptional regulator